MKRRINVRWMLLIAVGPGVAAGPEDPALAAVMARDAEIADAHGRGDMAAYLEGLSARYVYIDIGGRRVTADLLQKRRADDRRRVVSSETSEEEAVRLSDNVVLLRGLDRSVASYYGGLPRVSTTRWTALWVREADGVWRLTADTATPVRENDSLPFVHVAQPDGTLAALAGRWRLALDPPMEMVLVARDGKLIASLAGQQKTFTFSPASARHFFAAERPFELRFGEDGQSLTLVTWGTPTTATRVVE